MSGPDKTNRTQFSPVTSIPEGEKIAAQQPVKAGQRWVSQ